MKPNILLLLIGVLLTTTVFPQAPPGDDYGFLYWVHGWRGRSPEGERLFRIQASRYLAEWDVEAARLTRLERIDAPLPYAQAVSAETLASSRIPGAALHLEVAVGDTLYRCAGADLTALKGLDSPSRIIETGRYLQRFDIQPLRFETDSGDPLPGSGRLEVIAWPDRLYLLLEVNTADTGSPVRARMSLAAAGETLTGETALTPDEDGMSGAVSIVWSPDPSSAVAEPDCTVKAAATTGEEPSLPVSYDPKRGWYYVDLPEKQFDMAREPDYSDIYTLILENHTDVPVQAPLLFGLNGTFSGITGMTPILTDPEGRPSGLPVQISKNWHRKPEAPELYDGTWFHGFALVPLQPGERWEGRLQLVYALWGGVPAVSHAQLCLVGWGINQLWDQVAIGSWGETICYDPDINLNRSMVDDIRPLMVHGMGSTPEAPVLWNWTNNVGGGDFLVWFDEAGTRHFPERMRTAYLRYGPNLTEVVYAGSMGEGAIALRVAASSPRCDDVARAYHHLRYDVVKPAPFSRLAFYQLGADNYNDHQFQKLARGNREGLLEEWTFEPGGMVYDRAGVACEGDGPWWFSAHEAVPSAPRGGAWANRGLIVWSWDARLGGKPVDRPYAAFFGTENGIPGMNVELAPPPGLERLEPGDYVEALVELVVLPMEASEYYGPNEPLRADLERHANTWKPVERLARLNDLRVTVEKGELLQSYPIRLRANENGEVAFSVTGGAGYVPCTITGLSHSNAGRLQRIDGEGAASGPERVSETDYRQADYNPIDGCYEVTFNLLLDTPADVSQRLRYYYGGVGGS